jgi:hypothetical protein
MFVVVCAGKDSLVNRLPHLLQYLLMSLALCAVLAILGILGLANFLRWRRHFARLAELERVLPDLVRAANAGVRRGRCTCRTPLELRLRDCPHCLARDAMEKVEAMLEERTRTHLAPSGADQSGPDQSGGAH